jgi:hypothetical protein
MVQKSTIHFRRFTMVNRVLPEQQIRHKRVHGRIELWRQGVFMSCMVRQRDNMWKVFFFGRAKGQARISVSLDEISVELYDRLLTCLADCTARLNP